MFEKKLLLLIALLVLFTTTGLGLRLTAPEAQEKMQPVTLEYWRVWDEPDSFSQIIANYKRLHPNVNINYRKFRYDEYEKALLLAYAEDRAPDIFSLHNTWLRKYKNKIEPLPKEVELPFLIETGPQCRRQTKVEVRKVPTISQKNLKDNFVDVVYSDVLIENKLYGLPLAVDTLALYYNRDVLNNAGISQIPINWDEFQDAIERITKQDSKGQIVVAGAALGTAENITRSPDILSLLMYQNGTTMTDNRGKVVFNKGSTKDETGPAQQALKFYTDFSSPATVVYTWNETLPNSLEMFAQGQLGFFFGYSYHYQEIQKRAPRLNFGVTKVPQIQRAQEVNFANYWVETVSAKTEHTDFAWDFIQFAASEKGVKSYLEQSRRPTALRKLVPTQAEELDIGNFATQVLTARSWYHGRDANNMEIFMKEMITSVIRGEKTFKQALDFAAQKINQTI